MRRYLSFLLLASCGWLVTAGAHHSTGMYSSEAIELSGTVAEWQFSNPHVFVMLEVVDEAGEKTVWALEGMSTNVLRRRGWHEDSLQPGDKIIATVRPLHSGAPGGNYGMNLRWADGTEIDPTVEREQ